MRPHPDLTLTAAALAAVLLLHAAAALVEPPLVSLADVPAREGARIAVEARVLDLTRGARATYLTLADAAYRLPAFAPHDASVARGDLVHAVGVASMFDQGPGLSIDRLDVVLPALDRVRSPAELAASPASFEGARVLVRGEVRGDDLTGEGARVRLAGASPPDTEGEWLAAGTFRYHDTRAAYVLQVDAWTRPR